MPRQVLLAAWQRRGWLALLLFPISLLHGALTGLHRTLYRTGVLATHRVHVPVLVVGNVVAGGAGKTPVVMAVVRQLQAWGRVPGVISRGYGRQSDDCREVVATSTADEVGDEPLLVARATGVPVVVARQRIAAARALMRTHPEVDVIVADDGLQHRALHRDIELCVFDQGGIGNGWLLPAGPLREPWPRPVDLVLYTGEPAGIHGHRIERALAEHAVRADGTRVALSGIALQAASESRVLCAVAGVAHPEEFFGMLRARGLAPVVARALPDHARFGPEDVALPDPRALLLCTEKDATKVWPLLPQALAVPLELRIEPAFWEALRARLKQVQRPRASL